NDQLAGPDVRRNGFSGLGNKAEIGLAIFIQRGGHADDDRVHALQLGKVESGAEALFASQWNFTSRDAVDIGGALLQSRYLTLVNIEARDWKALLGDKQSKRQTHITQANDPDLRLASF